jgi:hypothetical protein
MNNSVLIQRIGLVCAVVALFVAGCGGGSTPTIAPTNTAEEPSQKQITFYVAGMNQSLKVM